MSHLDKPKDKLFMNNCNYDCSMSFGAYQIQGLLLFVAIVISGCASAPAKIVAPVESKPVATAEVVITSEMRKDFASAMEHLKAEEYDAGIELLSKVTKAAPNAVVPNIDLALAYKKTGKLKQAEDSLNLAVGSEVDNPVANNELALLYRKTGRFKEARQIYEKILDKYPNFRMVHKNLGILCDLYMKDYECALKHYVFYSSVVQDDKTVKIWIADLQKRSGR
jgi:tetratricopeptide (TPR) repeat protein